MADEETPAYINYGEAEEANYSGRMLTDYFAKQLVQSRRVSWRPTIKDSSLAKRMVKEYGQFPSETIVAYWIKYAKPEHVAKFNYMYEKRHEIKQTFTQKDYGWE